jgi:hypothetical protein
LSELNLSNNDLRSEGLSVVSEALKSTSIKQLNIADNMLTCNQQGQNDMSGVIKFANDMKDMGSLSSVDLLKNNMGDDQMQSLIKIKKEKGMASLCGLHQGQTEADFSNQGLGAEDAKLIASDIQDMGSLSRLDVSGNRLCGVYTDQWGSKQGKYDATGLTALTKSIGNLKELNISSNYLKAEGAEVLAPAIDANGALSKLDLSKNELRSEGLSVVSEALKSTAITQLNIAENTFTYNNQGQWDMSGVIKFAEDMKDMGSLSKLKMDEYDLPVQEIKTATALDLSGKGLQVEDAIVIVALIKVQANFKITLD